jgi:hypothetical protein
VDVVKSVPADAGKSKLAAKNRPADRRSGKGNSNRAPTPRSSELPDALQAGTTWAGELVRLQEGLRDTYTATFTVFERSGVWFKARLVAGPSDREILGTVKNGRIDWLAKDVVAHAGHPGQDHQGEIKGEEIRLEYAGIAPTDGRPVWGTVTLRLKK